MLELDADAFAIFTRDTSDLEIRAYIIGRLTERLFTYQRDTERFAKDGMTRATTIAKRRQHEKEYLANLPGRIEGELERWLYSARTITFTAFW